MNEYFINRELCPCCGYAKNDDIYHSSYTENPLRDYLISFYAPQGRVEFEYLKNQDYILTECQNCDLIYQREIPNDFLMHKLYEEWINPSKVLELFERNRRIDYFSRLSAEIIQVVRYFDVPPSHLQFLDFSMGWGHWCRVAQSFGCKVHGTEFSKIRAEHALSKGVAVIDYTEIPKLRFDFINTEQVFEHLPNPLEELSHLRESLKPHGIIKISTPNGWDIKKRLQIQNWEASKVSPDSLNPVAPLEHVNCFNHEALITLASRAGLSIVDLQPVSLLKKAKSVLRPYYHRLRGIKSPTAAGRKGTYLMFGFD